MPKSIAIFVVLLGLISPTFAATVDVTPLRALPVLDHGRIKPIDTLARETVRFITSYESFGTLATSDTGEQTLTGKQPALALMLDWAAHPVMWQTQPILLVPLLDLRAKLHMKPASKWISARELMSNADFTTWVAAAEAKRMKSDQDKENIVYDTPAEKRLEDAAVELDERLKMFQAASDLAIVAVLPTDGPKSDAWLSIGVILGLTGKDADAAKPISTAWTNLMGAYKQGDNAAFAGDSAQLADAIHQFIGADYADGARIDREVFYNWFKPFRWTWIIYLLTTAVLVAALMSKRPIVYAAAMTVFGIAILFHAGSFALRCSITGWAPVTNMYETVIWVAMMGAIFSYILELIYRQRILAIGGVIVALLATVVADAMPAEYGNSIRNLTPVLRSNYWLTIHVLTIVSSYAAFALALILGNIVLGQYIHGKVNPALIRTNLLFTYRAVQIGVLLVAAGTILGGLWADVSWGRFWGWDPKEVWALIVLLTYLALLHGRYAGWVRQFGLAAGAVICFTAVIMSWYGVNFVLGAGLHAYGFNTGGQGYVAIFVLTQWAYVLAAWLIHNGREKARQLVNNEQKTSGPTPIGFSPVTGK